MYTRAVDHQPANADQPAASQPAAPQHAPDTTGNLPVKLFVGFLMLACVALCVLVLRLTSQNKILREEVDRLAQNMGNGSLPLGEILPELSSFGPVPEPIKDAPADALKFDDGRVATVLFVHSGICSNCEEAMPRLISMAAKFRKGGLEFVGVQSDADASKDLKHVEANFPIRGVPGGERSWLRRVPLVPAILIVDHEGTLRAAWYGAMNPRQEAQFEQELERASKGYAAAGAKK